MSEKIRKTSQGGQDHFGPHGALDKEITQEGGILQLSTEEIYGYFSSLANTATTEKDILTTLVKSNVTLTISNASLTATIADMQRQLVSIGKSTKPTPTRQRRKCPNCKKEVYHLPDDCYGFKNNAHLRHLGWRSRLL